MKSFDSNFQQLTNRDIPTILKLVSYPKSGKFESDFGYEQNFRTQRPKQFKMFMSNGVIIKDFCNLMFNFSLYLLLKKI